MQVNLHFCRHTCGNLDADYSSRSILGTNQGNPPVSCKCAYSLPCYVWELRRGGVASVAILAQEAHLLNTTVDSMGEPLLQQRRRWVQERADSPALRVL